MFFYSCTGVQQADEEEMKLMASRPYRTHIFSVATFQDLKNIQEELINRLCAAVDEQLNSLVSGEEGELNHRTLLEQQETILVLCF